MAYTRMKLDSNRNQGDAEKLSVVRRKFKSPFTRELSFVHIQSRPTERHLNINQWRVTVNQKRNEMVNLVVAG